MWLKVYIVDVLIGPRFDDSNITMREVNHNFSFLFYNCLPWKKNFLGLFLVWPQHFLERILKFEKFPPILNRINVKLQITKTIIKKNLRKEIEIFAPVIWSQGENKKFCLKFSKIFYVKSLTSFALLRAIFISRCFVKSLTQNTDYVSWLRQRIAPADLNSPYSKISECITTRRVRRKGREEY